MKYLTIFRLALKYMWLVTSQNRLGMYFHHEITLVFDHKSMSKLENQYFQEIFRVQTTTKKG